MTNPNIQSLPRYRCHKEVRAAKIEKVMRGKGDELGVLLLRCTDASGNSWRSLVEVSKSWLRKHTPKAGGYLVVYADGYQSYSSADEFEDGYSLIGGAAADDAVISDVKTLEPEGEVVSPAQPDDNDEPGPAEACAGEAV